MSEHLSVDNIIAEIDAALGAPQVSVQEALIQAVAKGRMTIGEATECLDAYERVFSLGSVNISEF